MPKTKTRHESARRKAQVLASVSARANTHFYFFRELFNAYNKEYHNEMYPAADFWAYTMRAHLEAAVLNLCKLFDKPRTALRLHDFLNDVSGTVLAESRQEFDHHRKFCDPNGDANRTVKNLRRWRDEIIAHTNSARALSIPGASEKLAFDQQAIQELIDKCFAILDRWAPPEKVSYLDGTTKVWPNKFSRYIKQKECYSVVLESLRSGFQHGRRSSPSDHRLASASDIPKGTLSSILKQAGLKV
jgi:hypothetical protein